MTKQLDKATLLRLAWFTELKRQGYRQCHGDPVGWGDTVCALRLLLELLSEADRKVADAAMQPLMKAGEFAGLSREQASVVVCLNDGRRIFNLIPLPPQYELRKHTFREIEAIVSGWFPQ